MAVMSGDASRAFFAGPGNGEYRVRSETSPRAASGRFSSRFAGTKAHYQGAVGPPAKHKLETDQTGLDSLSEAHVVGNEKVDERHLDRANDRI